MSQFSGLSVDGSKMLYDHAKEYYDGTIQTQDLIRDKVKTLFGATSFTITLISASVALIKDTVNDMRLWWLIVFLFLFGIIVAHFIRALVLAIQTITREQTYAISTQEVITSLQTTSGENETTIMYLRLAACYRSAATQMHRLLTQRKESLILAQTSFKWGLIWLPVFFGLFLAYVSLTGSKMPQWATDLRLSLNTLQKNQQDQQDAQKQLDSRATSFETALRGLQGSAKNEIGLRQQSDELHKRLQDQLSKRLDAIESDMKRLTETVNRLGSRVDNAQHDADQFKNLQKELTAMTSRLRDLELQLATIAKKLETTPNVTLPPKQ